MVFLNQYIYEQTAAKVIEVENQCTQLCSKLNYGLQGTNQRFIQNRVTYEKTCNQITIKNLCADFKFFHLTVYYLCKINLYPDLRIRRCYKYFRQKINAKLFCLHYKRQSELVLCNLMSLNQIDTLLRAAFSCSYMRHLFQ